MIDPEKLRKSILPGTSQNMRDWILFTNYHHNSQRTEKETIEKFRGTVLGEYLSFETLDGHKAPENIPLPETTILIPEGTSTRKKVQIMLTQEQAGELYAILEKHKDTHPELHEVVYRYMTHDLFIRMTESQRR